MTASTAPVTHRAVSVEQYILKVHSRCDLACDHCYVYEHADQSWRGKPRQISLDTVGRAAERIAEHARARGLERADVVLHGGEPLLVGLAGLRAIIQRLHATLTPALQLTVRMQTNGVLLTESLCEMLADHDVQVGVSLDGDERANDLHRRFASGKSSHDSVRRALELLRRPEFRTSYAGILCTVDIRNDPIEVYEALAREDPPRIEFLLPHATWDAPPLRPLGRPTAYADWLLRIFDRWVLDGKPMSIRVFDSILSLARGGPSGTEAIGPGGPPLAVIETDGSWEQVDTLKVAYDGAAATGLNVQEHSVDDVTRHAGLLARQAGADQLCDTCRACPVVDRCGGGLFVHRYRQANRFDNPSVYCADLKRLVSVVDPRPVAAPSAPAALAPARRASPAAAVPDGVVEDVAAGRLATSSSQFLMAAQQLSAHTLFTALRERSGALAEAPGWELLALLEVEAPAAIQAVIGHPYARLWARRSLLRARSTASPVDQGYLAALAAVAAIRAGLTARVAVPVRDGQLHLPGLGSLHLAGSPVVVEVDCGAGGFAVHGVEIDLRHPLTCAAWRPAPTIQVGQRHLIVDDTDAYRGCHGAPATGPLPATELKAWAGAVGAAWQHLDDAGFASLGLGETVRVLTPLRTPPSANRHRPPGRHAVGAIGVPHTLDPATLQHALLVQAGQTAINSLLDLTDLGRNQPVIRVGVPWTGRPVPVPSAIRGYAARIAALELSGEGADLASGLARLRAEASWSRSGLILLDGFGRRLDQLDPAAPSGHAP